MIPSHLAGAVVAWLGTYLLHSSCLMAAALAAERILGRRSAALNETIWRAALLAPILTTMLQGVLAVQPVAGSLELSAAPSSVIRLSPADIAFGEASPVPQNDLSTGARAAREATTIHEVDSELPARTIWPRIVLVPWLVGVLVGAVRFLRASRRLRHLMRGRVQRPSGRFVRRLAAVMALAPPRISTSAAFATPFATGIRRPEICLPDRVVHELEAPQLNSILAHELAHIERRDPGWLHLYRLVHTIFFFQPLNGLARRRLDETSEVLADARAVALTGDHLGLARSIVDVAAWGVETRPRALVAAAATRGPLISRRVARLLSGHQETTTMSKTAALAIFTLIIASIFTLPAISSSAAVARGDDTPAARPTLDAALPAPPSPPAPKAVPNGTAVPAAPAPESEPAVEYAMQEAEKSLQHALERYQDRVIELDRKREQLEATGDATPEEIAKLAEERARLEEALAVQRAELRRRIDAARQRARTTERAERERSEERAERAHAEAMKHRERAEIERQRAVERHDKALTVSEEELAKRLQELEARERALAAREKVLQAREEALRRRNIPN